MAALSRGAGIAARARLHNCLLTARPRFCCSGRMPKFNRKAAKPELPPATDWRTTDDQEIAKRRLRARQESFQIRNESPAHPIFSNFCVQSGSGLVYAVEIRGIRPGEASCDCVDFRTNGLGFCKHVAAVLQLLEARHKRSFRTAAATGTNRIEVTLETDGGLLLQCNGKAAPRALARWFGPDGRLAATSPEEAIPHLAELAATRLPQLRISQEIGPWLENQRRVAERHMLRREYERKVQSGEWPAHETSVPLFPYQREGMLHLAFAERALLADEMGLGKTIQAIAACALLHRLGKARRVLVVTPASLKTEWEEQIRKFTPLDYQIVFGSKIKRLAAYSAAPPCPKEPERNSQPRPARPFFTIVNYEQMVADALDVNARLAPEVVVLDEAQRIKNWNTKTAQAIKRLRSRYAFVLTGTPIENRIDEIHSLMGFLDPSVLGPLFRFNRDFYELDERGRPIGCRNLDLLHKRIKPLMLRRRKADVETELPERSDRNHFVPLHDLQRQNYAVHEQQVMRLVMVAKRRPLLQREAERLQRELAMMRMICDTNFILDPEDQTCPKLAELEKILDDCDANDSKVIVFSEWERMLQLVRSLCEKRGRGFAWHTGSVPQQRRRAEINAFKHDPNCRVFLSTDSGATGLNLQNASVVINCDLPWNPARLEQRIARAWRKHQTKPVSVINLISEDTIEHRMLDTLAMKQSVALSVLDRPGEIKEIKLRGGRQAFLERLQQLVAPMEAGPANGKPQSAALVPQRPTDPAIGFAQAAAEQLQGALLHCEERYPHEGAHSVLVVVVERDPAQYRETLERLRKEWLSPGNHQIAETQLEVIDRATEETIQRLIAAGVISRSTRAARPLHPIGEQQPAQPLSAEEEARAKAHRERATRHLKMARVLGGGGFDQEARSALIEAVHGFTRAVAVEQRLPDPAGAEQIIQSPWARVWAEKLPTIKAFLQGGADDWKAAAERLAAGI